MNKEDIETLFGHLATGDSEQFFAYVADDVQWTVMGTHPLAGEYHSKQELLDHTFARLARFLEGGARLEMHHLHIADNHVIVEMIGTSTDIRGVPFSNDYCWVCRFEDDQIVEVRAYVDSASVAFTVAANEKELRES